MYARSSSLGASAKCPEIGLAEPGPSPALAEAPSPEELPHNDTMAETVVGDATRRRVKT